MKILVLGVLFALSLLFVSGLASAYAQINIYVDNAGNSLFLGESDSDLSKNLPGGIIQEEGKISGYTTALTTKVGDTWTFSYKLNGSELNVIFPEGTVVKNLVSGEVYLIGNQIGVYANDSVELSYSLTIVEDNSNLRIAIIILVFVCVFIAAYIYKKRNKKPIEIRKNIKTKKTSKNHSSVLENVLNDREKAILRKLREIGKTKSSYLRRELDIPKASFSRHVHELEKKKLVRLSGDGKNKFVEAI